MFHNQRPSGVPASRLELLRQVPMFADLTPELLVRVDGLMTEMTVDAGTTLVRETDAGREAFILAEGTAEVIVGDELVAEIGPGQIVGEMSLLDNQPRSATVVAKTPLNVLVMDPAQFASVFSDPHAAQWIAASLSNRLRAHLNSATERTPELHSR